MMIENTLEPRAMVGSTSAVLIDWALGLEDVLVLAALALCVIAVIRRQDRRR
jgi:hypothetical protein